MASWLDYWRSFLPDQTSESDQDMAQHPHARRKNVRILHTSGRYDRSPETVRVAAGRLIRDLLPDIWSGTEFQDDRRAAALHRPGRRLIRSGGHGGLSELFISVRDSYGDVKESGAFEITKLTFKRDDGQTAPPRGLAYVGIHAASGGTILYAVTHLANTRGNTVFPEGMKPREAVFKDAVSNSARWLHDHGRKYDAVILGADFNTRLGIPNEMRHYLRREYALAGLHLVDGPTGIDGFFQRGLHVTGARTLPGNRSSDHPPVFMRGTIRNP